MPLFTFHLRKNGNFSEVSIFASPVFGLLSKTGGKALCLASVFIQKGRQIRTQESACAGMRLSKK